jgi:hypothetical protein
VLVKEAFSRLRSRKSPSIDSSLFESLRDLAVPAHDPHDAPQAEVAGPATACQARYTTAAVAAANIEKARNS